MYQYTLAIYALLNTGLKFCRSELLNFDFFLLIIQKISLCLKKKFDHVILSSTLAGYVRYTYRIWNSSRKAVFLLIGPICLILIIVVFLWSIHSYYLYCVVFLYLYKINYLTSAIFCNCYSMFHKVFLLLLQWMKKYFMVFCIRNSLKVHIIKLHEYSSSLSPLDWFCIRFYCHRLTEYSLYF